MSAALQLLRTSNDRWQLAIFASLLSAGALGALVALQPATAILALVLATAAGYTYCLVRWPGNVLCAYILLWPPLTYWAIIPLPGGLPALHLDRVILLTLVVRSVLAQPWRSTLRLSGLDVAVLAYLVLETATHFHTIIPLNTSLQELLGFAYMPLAAFWLARQLAISEGRDFARRTIDILLWLGAYSLAIELIKPLLDLSPVLYPQGREFTWSDISGGRAAGPFYNPSIFGAVCSLCCYVSARRAIRYSGLWLVPTVLFGYGVLISFQRSAWLTLTALGLLLLVEHWRSPRFALQALVGGVAALAILFVSVQVDQFSSVPVPVVEAAMNRLTLQDGNTDARIALSEIGWSQFLDAPILGGGVGTSNFARPNVDTSQSITEGIVAHNTFLVILADRGLLTFLPLLLLVGLMVVGLVRARTDAFGDGLVVASETRQLAWASLITVLVTASVIDVHYFPYYLALTWILVAQALTGTATLDVAARRG